MAWVACTITHPLDLSPLFYVIYRRQHLYLSTNFFFIFTSHINITCVHTCHDKHVEVWEHLCGIGSFLASLSERCPGLGFRGKHLHPLRQFAVPEHTCLWVNLQAYAMNTWNLCQLHRSVLCPTWMVAPRASAHTELFMRHYNRWGVCVDFPGGDRKEKAKLYWNFHCLWTGNLPALPSWPGPHCVVQVGTVPLPQFPKC